jgi:hypothetical protein
VRRREETAQKRAQEDCEKQARKAEERVREIENARKISKLPKQAMKKTSKKPQSKISKRGGGIAVRSSQVAHKPSLATPSVKTRAGRITRPTDKLR